MEEKKSVLENIKEFGKNADYKKIIKTFTIIMAIAVIVFMTFANIGPNDEFELLTWITSAMILLGIMVFGLLMGESTSEDRQTNNPTLLYQRNLKKYNDTRSDIRPIDVFFTQFYVLFKIIELKKKKINYLISNGIDNSTLAEYIIKYITLDDLPLLTKQTVIKIDEKTGKEIKIRKLTDNEYKAVETIIKNGIKLIAPQGNYFLSAFGDSNDESVVEQKIIIEKKISANKTFNRLWKVLFSLVISLAWAFLTVKDFAEAGTAQAWMNLLSRLFALCTSYVSGYLSGV
ncbi:MAG: hypothetical protein PHX62_09500, partial [Bacilli bacterium]|nr:hypothetical protein [Bacilli bacterium]